MKKLLLILLALCALLLPQLLRFSWNNPYIYGSSNYASAVFFHTPPFVMYGLAIVLGIVAVLLLIKLLEQHLQISQWFITTLIIILSPFFFGTFTSFSVALLALDIILLALLIKNIYVQAGFFCIAAALHPYTAVAAAVLFLVYVPKNGYLPLVGAAAGSGAALVLFGKHAFSFMLPESALSSFMSEFGSAGYSLPLLLLACIGFYVLWKNTVAHIVRSTTLLVLFVLSYFCPPLLPVVALAVGLLAGKGAWFLYNRKWSLKLLKDVTILLVFCSMFFSLAAYTNILVKQQPTPALVQGLMYLRQTPNDSIILSAPAYYDYVLYFAQRQATPSPQVFLEDTRTLQITTELYSSRSIAETIEYMTALGATHLLFDPEMNQKLNIAQKTGIFFILQYGGIYTNIYDVQGITVWKFDAAAANTFISSNRQ
ncbi:MAG: hypothetical protein V1725_02845 [archaeon]